MSQRRRRTDASVPRMLAELWFAAAETIAWRSWMMACGRCSPAEYQRMVSEKHRAALESGLALALPRGSGDMAAALAPWRRLAAANARRLRRL